jgi:hypothetical protein
LGGKLDVASERGKILGLSWGRQTDLDDVESNRGGGGYAESYS